MTQPARQDLAEESLAHLLGGKRAALDATLGPVAFGVGYLATSSIGWGALAAVVVTAALGIWRLGKGDKPRAVLIGLFGVVLAALVALYTGKAEDFYLIRIVSNAASFLAFVVSVAIRWPLLGVIVGGLLGQKGAWRHDPDLLKAYSRASLLWSMQYLVRLVVFIPFWLAGNTAALTLSNIVLTWPLIVLVLAGAWFVIKRTLPPGHPGLRHPVPAAKRVKVSSTS
ncbi:DUF3159 domain-containing protein [Catelliglobosispora koreensis]|uniref:DUF3159 domain-containing protein n=1 Tax=Catelliglobosispora koreensis TaxID=129052 RepID=UPI000375CE91|nr:DUF3159 domain-containing protein [Catelliglobosispora koreensis]